MTDPRMLDDHAFDVLFREAHTHKAWLDRAVPEELLQQLYGLMKWGPTASNNSPARIVFVKSQEAKERLKPHLAAGNVEKTMTAPVTAIMAYDLKFYEKMDVLAPHVQDAKTKFKGSEEANRENAFRNGTLQGGYFIMAARALGLDCGPMSGFSIPGVRGEFFKGQDVEPNFLCNLGYGDAAKLFPRAPRLGFDEACKII